MDLTNGEEEVEVLELTPVASPRARAGGRWRPGFLNLVGSALANSRLAHEAHLRAAGNGCDLDLASSHGSRDLAGAHKGSMGGPDWRSAMAGGEVCHG